MRLHKLGARHAVEDILVHPAALLLLEAAGMLESDLAIERIGGLVAGRVSFFHLFY